MTWSVRKLALSGIAGATIFIFQLVALLVVSAFGLGGGGVIVNFVIPTVLVLTGLLVDEYGAITLSGMIYAFLAIPLPAIGPPGFLPKLGIIAGGVILGELVFIALSANRVVASVATGTVIIGVSSLLFWTALEFFEVTGVTSAVAELGLTIVVIVGAIQGAIGGFVGGKIFDRIETRPSVRRFTESTSEPE
jgi:hypothetical protein